MKEKIKGLKRKYELKLIDAQRQLRFELLNDYNKKEKSLSISFIDEIKSLRSQNEQLKLKVDHSHS